MMKSMLSTLKERRYKSRFESTLLKFHVNTWNYLYTEKDIRLTSKPHDAYTTILIELTRNTLEIHNLRSKNSVWFFGNTLYSEFILMNEVNRSLKSQVPMEHKSIKESINEIHYGLRQALEKYYELNTSQLKAQTAISRSMNSTHTNQILHFVSGVGTTGSKKSEDAF